MNNVLKRCSHENIVFMHEHYYDGIYQWEYKTLKEAEEWFIKLNRGLASRIIKICNDCNKEVE